MAETKAAAEEIPVASDRSVGANNRTNGRAGLVVIRLTGHNSSEMVRLGDVDQQL